jgi:hypothetical protein
MLVITGVARMVRFTLIGLLALRFGTSILGWLDSPVLQYSLIGLVIVCVVGSVISVWSWIRRSRSKATA